MSNLYYVAPLPCCDDEPDIPDSYDVCTLSGSCIATFDSYDDAVDLICLIEEFCESHGLVRRENLLAELYDLNLVCAECEFRFDAYCCNSCSTFRRLCVIRSSLDSTEEIASN